MPVAAGLASIGDPVPIPHQCLTAVNILTSDSGSVITDFRLLKSVLDLAQLVLLPSFAAKTQDYKLLPGSGSPTAAQAPHPYALAGHLGKLSTSFEATQGQSEPQMRFLSRANDYCGFLASKEAVLALRKAQRNTKEDSNHPRRRKATGRSQPVFTTDAVRMQVVRANPSLKVSGRDKLPGSANCCIGNDPKHWRTDRWSPISIPYPFN
jgi:hypothetical protein